MLEQFRAAGLLGNGGKQRSDSTYVLASVRDLNHLELAGRTLQMALDAIADIAPDWLRTWVAPDWYTRYGQQVSEFRLPQKKAEREALAVQIAGMESPCSNTSISTLIHRLQYVNWQPSKSCVRSGCSSMFD